MLRVVIVDDDRSYAEELEFSLSSNGMDVLVAHDGPALEVLLEKHQIDVILLDIGLPNMDGFAVLRKLQLREYRAGVIMLTARGDTSDKVRGLISGADAYLPKPVDVSEIIATIQAVARRLYLKPKVIQEGEAAWRLTQGGWVVVSPEGREYELTSQERNFLLIVHDACTKKHAVSRREIMLRLGRNPEIYENHFLDTLVSRIRSKLGKNFPLQTVRGVGYAMSKSIVKDL